MKPLRVDIWSDTVCPYCYVGKKRMEKVAAEHGIELEQHWHSFELNPDAPQEYEGGLIGLLQRKYGLSPEQVTQREDNMARLAKTLDIDFNWRSAKPGNTFLAHRLSKLADKHGLGEKMEERLFKAYMTEGLAISEPKVLEQLALEVGLPPIEVKDVINSDQFTDEVRQEEAVAQHQLRVTGVPVFIFNQHIMFSGAQPEDVFLHAMQQAIQEESQKEQRTRRIDTEATEMVCNDDMCEISEKS